LRQSGESVKQPFAAEDLGSPAVSESITPIALTHISDADLPGLRPAEYKPMPGDAGRGAEPRIWTRWKLGGGRGSLGRLGLALSGAGAVVLLLLGARSARSSREPTTSGAQVLESRGSGAASSASDLELGAQPPPSITEAADGPKSPADSVAVLTLSAPSAPDAVKTTGAHADAGPSGVAARKTAGPPRPALRSPPPKPSVPDDGRDELYVPALPKPSAKAPVPDDGRDELYLSPGKR
ncbi:MAG: hypothetical protein ACRENE_05580, partial [Polyangiaceae bacterium]